MNEKVSTEKNLNDTDDCGVLYKVLTGLAILLFFASAGGTSDALSGAVFFLFGALACYARRKQQYEAESKWARWETLALIILGIFSFIAVINGRWYMYPISSLIAPIIAWSSWIYILNSKQKMI